ncbi:hypothetical protein NX862_11760 [Rhodobacter sp. KR11]|uniref:hypothetical protein n=1 Tax=Rhodobacter sp. KR11 TaxID=2974588 RepID=UPI002221DAAA|nr:hypothetical protein [Rhodobacter sp. KR11]MCW1919430.1 hypothetical protein [Rhodobacter sp. KR11]
MRASYLHPAIFATFLIAVPAFGDTQAIPPEVQALAEVACGSDDLCAGLGCRCSLTVGQRFCGDWAAAACGVT